MSSRSARDEADAYDRYLKGMDASMKQKVALTAAHLLAVGDLADMGMGSGATSHALAALYPKLEVTGVDLDPEMVTRAAARWVLPNLSFAVGDIAAPVFSPGSQQAIVNSSVLHHVTSFGGYRDDNALDALRAQVAQLAEGGLLAVRDFVSPGDAPVVLELPESDEETLGYLRDFEASFRSLHASPGAELTWLGSKDGWVRVGLTHQLAAEFVLRKDYRTDWAAELQEAYTYATVAQFEAWYASLGLRVLVSQPLWNPWIVRNRYNGKFRLTDPSGAPLDPPATNYIIVGIKAPPGEGVHLEAGPVQAPVGYLELSSWLRDDGVVYELVRRRSQTLDVVPWFEQDGQLQVLTRRSYPRPILRAHPGTLDGATPAAWITEPIVVVQGDLPLALTVERRLEDYASIGAQHIRSLRAGAPLLPSAGGLLEAVVPVFVEVDPVTVDTPLRTSGFSTSGDVRAIEARQLLRGAAVGALPDARLELHVAELLLSKGRELGAWIGAEVVLTEGKPVNGVEVSALLGAAPRRRWRATSARERPFLELRCRQFVERDGAGEVVGEQVLEYVVPRARSLDTATVALLRRDAEGVWIGVDDDDLPAAQAIAGRSNLVVAPAWRLPASVSGRQGAREWVRERLRTELGVEVGRLVDLGGAYHPSAGVTPERVQPWAAEVTSCGSGLRALSWVRLDALVAQRHGVLDGHLRVVSLRAARAVGLL